MSCEIKPIKKLEGKILDVYKTNIKRAIKTVVIDDLLYKVPKYTLKCNYCQYHLQYGTDYYCLNKELEK